MLRDIGENVRIAADIADPAEIIERADAFVADVLAGRYRGVVEAVQVKENALALVRVLEARQRADTLVDKAAVLDATFRRARGERDAWLNWSGRVAPLMAADLGLEPERVAEVLAAHVHQQLVDLGEPELDLGGDAP